MKRTVQNLYDALPPARDVLQGLVCAAALTVALTLVA